jgi:hypothetical protein
MSKQLSKENWEKYRDGGKDVKENFCGACLAIPIAFVGVGASAYGASTRGQYKKQKKIALWGGIITTLLSVCIAIYYLYIKKCVDCGYVD